ncbi:MAG: insulinase family protein [Alphaproteobacteria bacterium]|nr:insulinase family protein [Alphaproteobacteria bacterium]
MQFVRRACALLVVLVLGACAQAGESVTGAPPRDARPGYTFWPHEISDIRPDPAVRFGVLPNGMRYALMRNAQPKGAISLRLRIAAGALQESDAQQGLAHFMEHMAFNGSKNVPEGEFVKLLQRKGLAFGAHTNAYTSAEETVYQLERPKNDTDLVGTGLMLCREVGDRLTLDRGGIEREKGVVLSEQRTRNTPEYRAFEDRWKLSHDGQRQAVRLPIGKAETIKGATRELLADYYTRFYRPERTMLIATGDFDPAEIEAKIKAMFADWTAVGADPSDPSQGPIKERGLTAVSHVEANLPESTTVTWFRAADETVDSVALRARNLHRRIALAVINRRLARLARAENAPFVSAGAGYGNTRGLSQTTGFSISTRPGRWQLGLAAVEQEYRRAAEHGFTASEVARELKEWRASLEEAAATQSTRETKALADQLTGSFDDRSVVSTPSDQLARFEKVAPLVTPASALAALREAAGGQGPVIFLSSSQPIAGGDAAIASAFEASTKTAVAAAAKEEAKTFPYANFGTPGTVAERREVADLGATSVRFANGVKLNFKATAFEKDTVYVTVRFAGGYIQLPHNKVGLALALPFGFSEGGLKQLTADELEESLAGRIVSNSLSLDEESFELSGGTNGRDLLLQIQLLAAFTTDPAYRGGGLERLQAAAENFLKQFSSSPGRVVDRETGSLVRSNDARWRFPNLADVKALKMGDIEGVLKPVLSSAPIEITVVGDAKAEDVIQTVAATFGALPARAAKRDDPPASRDVRFPARAQSLRFTHEGRPDQAAAYVAWPAPDFYSNTRRARATAILREVIEVRLTEEFREAQGATYSPSVRSWNSGALPDFGFIAASAETRPELVEGFYKTVDNIVAELKSGALTDDVLERAREPLKKSVETDRLSNGFWLGSLEDLQSEPRSLDAVRTQLSDLESITKAEVVAAAKQYLNGRRLEVRVLPRAQK